MPVLDKSGEWYTAFDADEPIVAICHAPDKEGVRIFVATSRRIFEVIGDSLHPLNIAKADDDEDA